MTIEEAKGICKQRAQRADDVLEHWKWCGRLEFLRSTDFTGDVPLMLLAEIENDEAIAGLQARIRELEAAINKEESGNEIHD